MYFWKKFERPKKKFENGGFKMRKGGSSDIFANPGDRFLSANRVFWGGFPLEVELKTRVRKMIRVKGMRPFCCRY